MQPVAGGWLGVCDRHVVCFARAFFGARCGIGPYVLLSLPREVGLECTYSTTRYSVDVAQSGPWDGT